MMRQYRNRKYISSNIKDLLGNDPCPNNKMVKNFVEYDILYDGNRTFFDGILDETSYPVFREFHEERFNDCNVIPRFRQLIEQSLFDLVKSMDALGFCLSGGIDSSSLYCIARSWNLHPKTFSVIYPDQSTDESQYINLLNNGPNKFDIAPTVDDFIRDLPDLIRIQEEPFRSPSVYAQYCLMKLARDNGIKVLIDGQGPDELLAGYTIYDKYWNGRPTLKFMKWFAIWTGSHFFRNAQAQLIQDKGLTLDGALRADLTKYSLPQLLRYMDKNAAHFGIEVREPYLDPEVVSFCTALPSSYKIHKNIQKWILREAMKDIMPIGIYARQDKIGFETPREWYRSESYRTFVQDIVESKSFKNRPYWDASKVDKADDLKLWRMICAELWLREFIDA